MRGAATLAAPAGAACGARALVRRRNARRGDECQIGIIWDISCTARSVVTRSGPRARAIYLGGVLAGLACGGSCSGRASGTAKTGRDRRVLGLPGPLGPGCASGRLCDDHLGPFDNWWHNAYGLDVKVLSPPHVILALGNLGIQLGSLFLVLSLQTDSPASGPRDCTGLLAAYVIGILLQNAATIGIEQIGFPNVAHRRGLLPGSGRCRADLARRGRASGAAPLAATTAALVYMAFSLGMIWILQLAPRPRSSRRFSNPLTTHGPPAVSVVARGPGLAIDLVMQRVGPGRDWWLSALVGLASWSCSSWRNGSSPSSAQSRAATTFCSAVDHWDYSSRPGPWRYRFWRAETDPVTARALAIAALLAVLSARLGLGGGTGMARLRR